MPRAKPHLNKPYLHASLSGSLEGMEKSIPSFQEFMKTAPPDPLADRPLPPVPQQGPSISPSQLAPKPSSTGHSRRSEGLSWATPSSWEYEAEARSASQKHPSSPSEFFLQPMIYNSSSSPGFEKPAKTRSPEPRVFSPLLDDPDEYSPYSTTESLNYGPAFEYDATMDFHSDLGSNSTPPKVPLPPVSLLASTKAGNILFTLNDFPTPPSSVADSTAETSSAKCPVLSTFQGGSASRSSSDQRNSTKKLMPRPAAPGAENWEGLGESTQIKYDRRSQDYHNALVEQYRDLVPRSSEIFRDSEVPLFSHGKEPNLVEKSATNHHNANDEKMVPKPLSYSKNSSDAASESSQHSQQQERLRRHSSLREKMPGTLKMILPTHHARKSSSQTATNTPVSPSSPRKIKKHRPRAIAVSIFPSSPTAMFTSRSPKSPKAKAKKAGKRGGGFTEHTPPLKLSLVASLSSTSSSRRPSAELSARSRAASGFTAASASASASALNPALAPGPAALLPFPPRSSSPSPVVSPPAATLPLRPAPPPRPDISISTFSSTTTVDRDTADTSSRLQPQPLSQHYVSTRTRTHLPVSTTLNAPSLLHPRAPRVGPSPLRNASAPITTGTTDPSNGSPSPSSLSPSSLTTAAAAATEPESGAQEAVYPRRMTRLSEIQRARANTPTASPSAARALLGRAKASFSSHGSGSGNGHALRESMSSTASAPMETQAHRAPFVHEVLFPPLEQTKSGGSAGGLSPGMGKGKIGLVARAVAARKEKERERRRDEIKASIRVVGERESGGVDVDGERFERVAWGERGQVRGDDEEVWERWV